MDQQQRGLQASLDEAPIPCANNCGFFGTATTMNLCSKCHKDLILKEHGDKLASSPIGNILGGKLATMSLLLLLYAHIQLQLSRHPLQQRQTLLHLWTQIVINSKKVQISAQLAINVLVWRGLLADVAVFFLRFIVILTNMTALIITIVLLGMPLPKPTLLWRPVSLIKI